MEQQLAKQDSRGLAGSKGLVLGCLGGSFGAFLRRCPSFGACFANSSTTSYSSIPSILNYYLTQHLVLLSGRLSSDHCQFCPCTKAKIRTKFQQSTFAINMSSCFGFRKSKGEDTEMLLPQYEDDTSLQRSLHMKMHSYQMVRALAAGFMPSTEQLIINLRTLLASDILNSDNPDLSDSGRLLLKFSKRWLMQFIEALRNKNDGDQVQDFIWFLTKSRISLDTDDLAKNASKIKARADATAGAFIGPLRS